MLNGLSDPNRLKDGQMLYLAPLQSTDVPASAGATATPAPLRTYIVRPGDTLLAIALRLNVTVDEIATLNNLRPPYPLKDGQELTIPN